MTHNLPRAQDEENMLEMEGEGHDIVSTFEKGIHTCWERGRADRCW